MKRVGIWFVSILGVVAAIIFGLFLFSPNAGLLIVILISPLLHNYYPPPIAQGVISNEDRLSSFAASRRLTEALQTQFPAGSKEDTLKSILLGQGFRFEEPPPANCVPHGQDVPIGVFFYRCLNQREEEARQRTLVYGWGIGVCGQRIFVTWSSDERGTLINVKGQYTSVCL